MKEKGKIVFNFLFFILLIFLTYYIIFRDYSIKTIISYLKDLNKIYLFIAFFLMNIYFLLEGLNLRYLLKTFNEKVSVIKSYIYTLICFFFSAITPASSGGQPMTIYCMSKDKIKISHASLSYLIQLFGYNISAFTLGIIFAIARNDLFKDNLLFFFIIGSIFNLIPITITSIGIFSKKLLNKVINIFIKIISILKIKNIDNIKQKINDELKIFNDSSNYIKHHKIDFIKSIILSFIQVIIYYSIPFFIFKSFNLSGYSILFFIELQAILHNSVASIPLPGSVGITETIFLIIYSYVYSSNALQSSLIVNRIITFYSFVLISLIIYIINKIRYERKQS